MVRSVSVTRVVIAVLFPLAGLTALATPASAAVVHASGSITCAYGTTMTFNPPLTPGIGTAVGVGVNEVITIAPATLSRCTGTVTTGSVPSAGLGTNTVTVTMKATVLNHVRYAGGCFFFPQFHFPSRHAKFGWTAPSGALAPTVAALPITGASPLIDNGLGNDGYTFSGTTKGSFAGTASIGAYFDAASTAAIQGCIGNAPGAISSATVDPSVSSISVG